MEAIKYENYHNQNLGIVRNRMKSKQQLEHIRSNNDDVMKRDEEFNRKKLKPLDCQVYLYGEEEDYTQQALIFHFQHCFNITVQGIVVEGRITNLEFIGLPRADGKYYILTRKCIKCIPNDVISCSKKNKLNDTANLNSRDWNFQTLALLHLDDLVQTISDKSYIAAAPPQIEPPPTFCDNVRNKTSGFLSYFTHNDSDAQNKKEKKEKVPVQLPQNTVPHVPSEYDETVRDAVVIRYNKGGECGLIFHFQADDSFRTIKGVWDENILKPSLIKQRPTEAGGTFMELCVSKYSPIQVREMALENKHNGAAIDSGITEIDWAKEICNKIGFYERWDNGTPWRYFKPPQYTVAPDRTVFKFPSSS